MSKWRGRFCNQSDVCLWNHKDSPGLSKLVFLKHMFCLTNSYFSFAARIQKPCCCKEPCVQSRVNSKLHYSWNFPIISPCRSNYLEIQKRLPSIEHVSHSAVKSQTGSSHDSFPENSTIRLVKIGALGVPPTESVTKILETTWQPG